MQGQESFERLQDFLGGVSRHPVGRNSLCADAHRMKYVNRSVSVFQDLQTLDLAVLLDDLAVWRVTVIAHEIWPLLRGECNLDVAHLCLHRVRLARLLHATPQQDPYLPWYAASSAQQAALARLNEGRLGHFSQGGIYA